MEHVSEEQLYAAAFDGNDTGVMDHLEQCSACHRQFVSLQRLAQAFDVARLAEPSHEQVERYRQMATHLQPKTSFLPSWIAELRATLLQDSRQRLALQGIRSGGQQAYRLLYTAEKVDIELLVDALGSTRRIEGEVLPITDADLQAPVLVELHARRTDAGQILTTESNKHGRFLLDGVALGAYDVVITPVTGPSFRIEEIHIT